MRTLSIDQSLTCSGYCLFDDQTLIDHGTLTTKPNKTDPLDAHRRITYIADWFTPFITDADQIAIEGLAFASNGLATRQLAALQYAIVSSAIGAEKRIQIIAPTTLKKYATGHGKAKKIDLYDSLPPEVKDVLSHYKKTKGRYDVTDSYWLGRYALDA